MVLRLNSFFVAHDRCAMKVGTDGILLGAWAPVAGVKRILDIGTGSGLQALMLAQRTEEHVTIDAVELDPQAARQASENAADSPWAERIRVECADVLTSGAGADRALRFDCQQSAVFHAGAWNVARRNASRHVTPARSITRRY